MLNGTRSVNTFSDKSNLSDGKRHGKRHSFLFSAISILEGEQWANAALYCGLLSVFLAKEGHDIVRGPGN